jgi:hypothetical protein
VAHRSISPVLTATALAAAGMAVALAISFLPPSNWTWGIDLLRYYPAWLRATWFAAGIALLGWSAMTYRGWRPALPRWPAPVLGLLAGALSGVVFHLARARTGLLGDGYQIVVDLRQGHPPTARSPLYNLLEPWLVRWQRPGGVPTLTEAGLLSTLVGALAVAVVTTWLVRRAREGTRPAASTAVIAGVLLAGPWIQLFFGYVECYALLAVAVVVFLVAALDRSEGRGGLLVPFLALVLAIAAHPFGLLLVPAFLILVATGDAKGRIRRVATWTGALAVLGVAGWLAATLWPRGPDGRSPVEYLSPLRVLRQANLLALEETGVRDVLGLDSILSLRQAADVLNHLWLTAAPALFVLAALACDRRGRRSLLSPAAVVAMAAAVAFLLARAGMRTILGPMRDWDIFAGVGIAMAGWAAFAAADWIADGRSRLRDHDAVPLPADGDSLATPAPAVPLAADGDSAPVRARAVTPARLAWTAGAVSVLFLVPWIGIQADSGRAVARHLALADGTPPLEPAVVATFHSAMGLRFLSLGESALAGSAFERAWTFRHSWNYAWRAGLAYLAIGQAEKAAAAFNEVTKVRPEDPRAFAELGSAWNSLERYDRAEAALRRAIALDGRVAAPRIHLARTLGMLGREREGRQQLEAARPLLRPGDPLAGEFRLLDANLPPLYPTPSAPAPADGTHR